MDAAEASTADHLAEIRAMSRPKGESCATGTFVGTLTQSQREAISEARAEGIKPTDIGRWLKTLGLQVGTESAVRHITGHCACQTR